MINKIDTPLSQANLKMDDDGKGYFEGYASVFNGDDAVGDTIEPGAYKDTIKAHKKAGTMPKMFINHDSWMIPPADIIEMAEDKVGLFIKGVIDFVHKDGPSLHSALLRKAIDAFSIGFRLEKDGYELKDEDNPFSGRIISKIDLHEVSFVNFPADDAARIVTVKSDIEQLQTLREFEKILRDSGHSKAASTAMVSRFKNIVLSDSGDVAEKFAKHHAEQNTARLVNFIENIKVKSNV